MPTAIRLAAIVALSLSACGGTSANWTPYSAAQTFPETLKHCVLFYEGDVQRVKDVGAVYAGKVTVYGRRAGTGGQAVLITARDRAARAGGTHCIAFGTETSTATRGAVLAAWPNVADVVPSADQRDVLTLLVFHVPEPKWPTLPEALRPKRSSSSEEFNW